MVFKVTLGCTVTGRVGPLVYARPDAKNRTRTVFEGTVVETVPNNLWKVYWHDMQLTATHKPKELKFVSARKPNCSDEQLKVLSKSAIFVGDKVDLNKYVEANYSSASKNPSRQNATSNQPSSATAATDHTSESASVENSLILLPPHPRSIARRSSTATTTNTNEG